MNKGPNVCIVGQKPEPLESKGMLNQAKKTSTKVKAVGKPAVTLKSEITRSQGDEKGTGKGVMSGTNMGKVTFKRGSSKVKVEGQPWVCMGSDTAQNGSNANCLGSQVSPSQDKVFVAP